MTDDYASWIGRERREIDMLEVSRARAMQATLGDEGAPLKAGDGLPPLWHWLYFWEVAAARTLGYDGHPERGDFLPPLPLKRRMWAGSRVSFPAPLPLGGAARRRSKILKVELKQGRSGALGFVTVAHEIAAEGSVAVEEEHDIVYRAPPAPGEQPRRGEPAPPEARWRQVVEPDATLLFRYSALTFNGHRIHYDRRFCLESEGYPGLVVHGPLLATLMVELARREGRRSIFRFQFRALAPVFDTAPFAVCGQPTANGAALWIADADNRLCMQGEVEWA